MKHRQFQYNTAKGGTDVQFDIEHGIDNAATKVLNIQFHSNFESGLPTNAYLEYDAEVSSWRLCHYYDTLDKDQKVIRVKAWLADQLACDILARILEIKDEETPKFS